MARLRGRAGLKTSRNAAPNAHVDRSSANEPKMRAILQRITTHRSLFSLRQGGSHEACYWHRWRLLQVERPEIPWRVVSQTPRARRRGMGRSGIPVGHCREPNGHGHHDLESIQGRHFLLCPEHGELHGQLSSRRPACAPRGTANGRLRCRRQGRRIRVREVRLGSRPGGEPHRALATDTRSVKRRTACSHRQRPKEYAMATVREGNTPVVVVVDVQVGVMKAAWEAQRVIGNVVRAVERARSEAVPVIWVQHSNHELPMGSVEWQWVPELVPAEGEALIHKRYNSSFEQTSLDAELARLGATHIVLAGAATKWC